MCYRDFKATHVKLQNEGESGISDPSLWVLEWEHGNIVGRTKAIANTLTPHWTMDQEICVDFARVRQHECAYNDAFGPCVCFAIRDDWPPDMGDLLNFGCAEPPTEDGPHRVALTEGCTLEFTVSLIWWSRPPQPHPPATPAPPALPPGFTPATPAPPALPPGFTGCPIWVQRQQFAPRLECTVDVPCSICGHDPGCATRTFPSGMEFPRHNVLQYIGNGVWQGNGLSFSQAVAAMLGDPFAYTSSPVFAAYKGMLQGHEAGQLKTSLMSTWRSKDTFFWKNEAERSRQLYFDRAQRLTRDLLISSDMWITLPDELRQLILAHPQAMPEEAATCAAAALLDALFLSREKDQLWKAQFLESSEVENGDVDGMSWNGGSLDAHDVVYTSVYENVANKYYGSTMTIAYFPSDKVEGGSGLDSVWARGNCPHPAGSWEYQDNDIGDVCWKQQHFEFWDGCQDPNTYCADAGELRTPGYKMASEVAGLALYSKTEWHSWTESRLDWAFYRTEPEKELTAENEGGDSMCVTILAPGAVGHDVSVFGITRDNEHFVATSRAQGDYHFGQVPDQPERQGQLRIPVWGALFRCPKTEHGGLRIPGSGEQASWDEFVTTTRVCDVIRDLRRMVDTSTLTRMKLVALPANVLQDIGGMEVWKPGTSMATSISERKSGRAGHRESVCMLDPRALLSSEAQTLC